MKSGKGSVYDKIVSLDADHQKDLDLVVATSVGDTVTAVIRLLYLRHKYYTDSLYFNTVYFLDIHTEYNTIQYTCLNVLVDRKCVLI